MKCPLSGILGTPCLLQGCSASDKNSLSSLDSNRLVDLKLNQMHLRIERTFLPIALLLLVGAALAWYLRFVMDHPELLN